MIRFAVICFLAAFLPAQKIAVTPDPLYEGGKAKVTFTDVALAKQTIIIDVDNGEPDPDTETDVLIINLDANGEGSTEWNVPDWGWDQAVFNGPGGATDLAVILGTSEKPGPPPEPADRTRSPKQKVKEK